MSLLNPIGSIGDKVNVGLYRIKSLSGSIEDIYAAPEVTTEAKLIQVGACHLQQSDRIVLHNPPSVNMGLKSFRVLC
jgi:hypothetical protein